ncbi:MAG: glycosyltransferase family 4 protein [Gemmatimonadales bacterium]|nr:MAG: glycosyltransferase family 4 protein [Gemmatimonadales bacterium]
MTEPLRIIHLLRGAQGGSFRHLCDLAAEQAARGHQVGIVASAGVGGAATDAALAALEPVCALGVHRLAMERSLGWSDLSAVRSIRRVLQATHPDIVHGHGAKGAAYARLVARGAGARSIYTPHGGSLHYSWGSPAGVVYLTLERVLKRRTDGLIFASDHSRRTYEEKLGPPTCPWRVIHNGLHDQEFEPVPRGAEEYDFVFVGEIRRLKGIDVLLDAVAELAADREFSVLMVGAGPDEARLRDRVRELGLESTVILSPPIHPARHAFAIARCVVMPSLAESLPYIILEVLASRVPLLATRVGGIPEIFGPHTDSLLPAGDSHVLAAAMATFLDDPGPALEEAALLHGHVKRQVRVPQMADATLELYRTVLETGNHAPAATTR